MATRDGWMDATEKATEKYYFIPLQRSDIAKKTQLEMWSRSPQE